MSNPWTIEYGEFEEVTKLMNQFAAGSGQIIDSVFHNEGAEEIKERIAPLIPRSGRKWAGKGASASSVMPGRFSQDNGQLSVTIAARGKYGYLYFPDDGSNTRRHAGNKQFMRRGAEAATARVIEMCVGKLIEQFEQGE